LYHPGEQNDDETPSFKIKSVYTIFAMGKSHVMELFCMFPLLVKINVPLKHVRLE